MSFKQELLLRLQSFQQIIFVIAKELQMRIVIQLIENYLKQEVPTIQICTENNKYLFNVPSSYQRFTKEHRSKFPTGARFFFTKTSTRTITGLTGLILTLFHLGSSGGLKLYTDQQMFRYLEELRYKMGYKAAPLSYCSWEGKLRKGVKSLSKLEELSKLQNFGTVFDNLHEYIQNNLPPVEQNNAFDYYNPKQNVFKDEQLQILPFFIKEEGELITNYIIIPGALPGKLMVDKLKEFGIKGKSVSQLTKDGSITIEGRTISIEEVRQPSCPSPNVIILHYRHSKTIRDILENPRFKSFVQNKNNLIYSVIHIVQDPQTIFSQEYKQLLSIFNKQTEHIIYNNRFRNSTDSLEDLVRLSSQVRLVSSLNKHFPICMPDLYSKHAEYVKEYLGNTETIDKLFPQFKVTAYKRCHELIVAPKKSWGYKLIGGAEKKQSSINMEVQVPDVKAELSPQEIKQFKDIDPKIVFLGTGSMKPSRYRNVSSILVEWLPKDSIMFDCGQGSHIQLIDHYGYKQYEEVLIGLRIIFISHIHSDHNLGLLDLISQRTRILKQRKIDIQNNKLFLILPANVVPWYNSFCKNVQNLNEGCSVIFIQALRKQDYTFEGTISKEAALNRQCSAKKEMVEQSQEGEEDDVEDQLDFIRPEWNDILKQYFEDQQESLKEFQRYLESVGISEFYPCPVIHCPQSYGICIKHFSGIKISYSGDTKPCQEFAKAANQSTILIHEATFGDDLAQNADSHYHSTVGQALDIAMLSNSWKLALTHFSQRYKSAQDIVDPKNYIFNKPKRTFADKHTILCFDHLQIQSSKSHLMPEYSRAIAAAIPKESKE